MKVVLKSNPISVDPRDYFDEEKQIYGTIPVFPFLTEDDVQNAISESINLEKFDIEISALIESSNKDESIIADTSYIICLVDWQTYPELIQLLTILREWAFRNEGGGVGSNDFDEFDENPHMRQLIILDKEAKSAIGTIIGGYRYMVHNRDTYHTGPMGAHFEFSESWKKNQWIELGRSFINPWYQSRNQRLSFDLVLHGLGFIRARHKDAKGYFGKITLYKVYELQGADRFFLGVGKKYLRPTSDFYVDPDERVEEGELTLEQIEILDKDVFKGLFYLLRKDYQINLVPIMAIYNRMTKLTNIYYSGAFKHQSFGDSIEMGIAIAFEDIYEVIIEKFARPYMD